MLFVQNGIRLAVARLTAVPQFGVAPMMLQ